MKDCAKNLYQILEVDNNASLDEIKKSYKKLARIYHPDLNKSKSAEITFKLLNSAYGILSNELKRKEYDKILKTTLNKNFKKIPDKNSIIKEIKITELERQTGTKRIINILNTQKCPICLGKKFLNGLRCNFCKGIGKKKEFRQIEIEIEANVKNGDLIFAGKINSSEVYDKELFLKVITEETVKMHFEGEKIIYAIEIPVYDAILGCKKDFIAESIGTITVDIPPNTFNKKRIKIETKEFKNCYAEILVSIPNEISDEEKILYDKIRQINLRK